MKKIYEEASFIAYYFHWDMEKILKMEHRDRLKWCSQISDINDSLSDKEEKGVNIFDI